MENKHGQPAERRLQWGFPSSRVLPSSRSSLGEPGGGRGEGGGPQPQQQRQRAEQSLWSNLLHVPAFRHIHRQLGLVRLEQGKLEVGVNRVLNHNPSGGVLQVYRHNAFGGVRRDSTTSRTRSVRGGTGDQQAGRRVVQADAGGGEHQLALW